MPEKKGSHLTLNDRCVIEAMIKEKKSFRAIATVLNVSITTVSNELKSNRIIHKSSAQPPLTSASCGYFSECAIIGLCPKCRSQAGTCSRCRLRLCIDFCKKYDPSYCPTRENPPYVCDTCSRRAHCTRDKAHYSADKAQALYENRLRNAHTGISCDEQELLQMVSKVKTLLGNGQSLEAIWATHGEEFPVGVRTFYSYMDKGVMGLANIDLPKKVKYTPRKKYQKNEPKMDFTGRTYADWLNLPDDLKLRTVQIDCIEGKITDTKCILSLHFIRLFFQIYILLPAKTQACVKEAIDALEMYCEGRFTEVFPVILGDRGSEFLNFLKIEEGLDKMKRTQMFYCDPLRPGQKGSCEKNHVEFRKIIPKGTSLDTLTQWDVALVCSHVNSYIRAGQGVAPIKLASVVLPANLLESLGIVAIAPDDVIMKPKLLKQ